MPRMKLQPKIWNSTKLLARAGITNSSRAIAQTGVGTPSSTISRLGRVAGRTCAMSVPRHEQALRTEGEDDGHDQEREDHRIGGRVDKADLLGKADDDGAERGPGDRAHSTHDDDHERGEQKPRVLARRQRLERAADNAGDAGHAGAE